MAEGEKVITTNRRVGRDFLVLDRHEAGIALTGTEVKSLRATGNAQLKDSYVQVDTAGNLYLLSAHISPYEQGNIFNHDPERPRRLLMHRREILKLRQRVEEKGLTLIPLRLYFKRGKVKVEVGVCKGKHSFDKRETIKQRETAREMDRAVKDFRRG